MRSNHRMVALLLTLGAALFASFADVAYGAEVIIGVGGVTQATYEPTTAAHDMVGVWRKVQGDLIEGFNFAAEEWEHLGELEEFRIDWSAREIMVPIDLNDGVGVASIPEGGWEARPSSPSIDELFLSWILLNKRFTATKTAKWIDQRNKEAMIRRQIVHQGKKAVQTIGQDIADRFYGFSTGVLAQVGTGAAGQTQTFTVTNGYGLNTITDPEFVSDKLRPGEWIALIRDGELVANAIGRITARNRQTGELTVTFNGAVTSEAGDNVVKANSLENTTITGTDYNRSLVGLLEMAFSDSLHSLATSDHERWAPALQHTTGGRFHTLDLHTARTAINDHGGGKVTDILYSVGVYRDVLANQLGLIQFTNPMALELDADVKMGGVNQRSTKRVPPGMVMAYDRSSIKKMTLLERPTEGNAPQWGDGEKIPDRSAYVFSIDYPCQMVNLNRGNLAVFTGMDEQ